MAIETTAQLNKDGKRIEPAQDVNNEVENRDDPTIDWEGLSPATNKRTNEPQDDIRRDMGEKVITDPHCGEYGRNSANRTPMPPQPNPPTSEAKTKPKRGSKINRSARPTKQDEKKVERLAAPDWRSDQPMPSAKNAVDPRGENTPEELFENKEADNE